MATTTNGSATSTDTINLWEIDWARNSTAPQVFASNTLGMTVENAGATSTYKYDPWQINLVAGEYVTFMYEYENSSSTLGTPVATSTGVAWIDLINK